ncbi:MAG: alpha/beta hydrolase [Alphaproteobacteria bacterium]|nr:alpha/beta hydrolase [Alphaproteobacteria bacterium]
MRARALAALTLLLGLSGCTGLFFQPMSEHVFDPKTIGFVYEDVTFEAADGVRLHGWFFPAEGERDGSVLFLHGNAENISTHFAGVAWLAKAGIDAFVVDYRGYGRSLGEPTLDGLHRDAAAALDTLIAMPGIEPERIAVFGQSLGGAVALGMVAASPHKDRLAALIVEGTLSDYRAIAREKLGDFWLTWPLQWPLGLTIDNRYSPTAAAALITPLPLLIIHGQEDEIVPPHHAEILFDAAKEPKTIWRPPDTGHIQAFATVAMRERLRDYLTALFAGRAPPHQARE